MQTKKRLKQKITDLSQTTSEVRLNAINKQQSHQHCMVCGSHSLLGLKINFYSDQYHHAWALFKGNSHQQGYQGILHGGFLSVLLDGAMCQVVFNKNIEAVTADMNIRFLHEVPINSELLIKAEVISNYFILYKVKAEIYVGNKLMVKADARFMKKAIKK
ncbi:PaaI family thioesterase [Psychromonas hadalis]|uniref:PaaI family thioesterase n=1 Tax=Psychromonas hadalis TaxID=211669 RepID=UPI0003B5D22A|nr:PaaI family thioesterase [Psychromonas hadalis]